MYLSIMWGTKPFSNCNPPRHKWVEILFAAREVELHPIKADNLFVHHRCISFWLMQWFLSCLHLDFSLSLFGFNHFWLQYHPAAGKWLGSNVVRGSPMLHGSPGNIATVWVKRLWTASQGGSLKGYRSFTLRSYMWQKHLGCFFSYS